MQKQSIEYALGELSSCKMYFARYITFPTYAQQGRLIAQNSKPEHKKDAEIDVPSLIN